MATFFTDYSQPQTQTSLSDMINTARGAQEYQQSQQMNPLAVQRATAETQTAQQGAATGAMELQKAQQANQERLKMMEFMKTPDNYQTNGRVDIDKLNKSIPSIAPMTGHAYIENITKLGQAQSTAESASTKLTTEQRQLFGPALIGLSNAKVADPKIYDSMLDHITEQYPGNKHVFDLAQSYKKMLKMASPNGAANPALPQLAGMAGTSLLSGEQVQAATAPKATLTDVGGQITPTVTQPSVFGSTPTITPTGPAIQKTMAPGGQMQLSGNVDANNAPTYYLRNATGNIIGEFTIPAGGGQPVPVQQGSSQPQGQGQPSVQGQGQPQPQSWQQQQQAAFGNRTPVRMPAYETPESMLNARKIQLGSNQAAAGAQYSQFNNNKIIDLADKAFTGAGAETLAKLGGGYSGLPWTSNATENMQILGHQMALETANIAGQAGFGTDAARALGEKMSGTTNWTPEAIKSTARMNRALSTGISLFNQGVNNAVKSAGNNPMAAREFQNKWSSTENLLPTLSFIDAVRNKDQTAIRAIVDSKAVGGYGTEGYKKLLKQAGIVDNLVKGQ